ncbi:HAD family phosphatase [Ferruginibacter sp. HRS2-29]|uniref:HAD family hydrolase n=1 Tax=Ferruginibacter sp. HRS2-29 TaxID=2487334 RepID=UPI0020CBE728|nr:HAD family phosphatase [Ferruginibacter sp. HRS2-29]MCP9753455.1 HAD family phosphatase [Ferruginibacter sp. HRS2-29]
MNKFKAFLFDLNGTMIDDMQYHIMAWHRILNDLGFPITEHETKMQCYGKNNELLERIFPGHYNEEDKNRMSLEKETAYQENYRPHLKLIEGLEEFLKESKEAGIKMAIGSAAILYNVDFVLDGLNIRHYLDAVVGAEDVVNSKPDPETFIKCAAKLNVGPADCLVFEDSPKGTEAALRAGMKCIAITTMHTREEFNDANIIRFIDFYTPELLQQINDK